MNDPSATANRKGTLEFATVRAIIRFLKPHVWVMPAMVLFGVISSTAEGVGIGLLIPLIDSLLDTGKPTSLGIFGMLLSPLAGFSRTQQLLIVGAFITIFFLIKGGLVFITVSLSSSITGRVSDEIRRTLFRQMLEVDYGFLVHGDQGRLVNAFETQTWRALDAMTSFFTALANICTITVFAVLLLAISWKLTIGVAVAGIGASLIVGRPMVRRLQWLGDRAVGAASEIAGRVINTLNGMRVIRAFGQEEREQERFGAVSSNARTIFFQMDRLMRTISTALEVVYAPIFIGAILAGQYLSISVPTLLAFLVLYYRIQPQVRNLDQERAHLAANSGALLELAALIDTKSVRHPGTLPVHGLNQSIVFDKVSLQYRAHDHETRHALSNVSLQFDVRQMTAIVGASGAGKSSLINLLYAFYEPTEGEIRIDGTPLRSIEITSWRNRMALAGQDAFLLDGTILDNIRYGSPDANMDTVIEAARQAAAHDFIMSFPSGYQTEVGDRGIRLSEGQRQRIGLARAMLRSADILILDEATNALDGLTENTVHQTLARLLHKTTLIVIAHRFATVRMADHVIVLDHGTVMEQGPPGDLLRRGSAFARLYAAGTEHEQSSLV